MPEHDGPIAVHVVSTDVQPVPEKRKDRTTVASSFSADGTQANYLTFMLLGRTPNRVCATIGISGDTPGESVLIADSQGDASNGVGAPFPVNNTFRTDGNDELWLIIPATVKASVGVLAVYEN